jgi:hypothetical protein
MKEQIKGGIFVLNSVCDGKSTVFKVAIRPGDVHVRSKALDR